MKSIKLRAVSSSSNNFYNVTFESDDQYFRASCTCNAGKNNMYCKHIIDFIFGKTDRLYDLNDSGKLNEFQKWVEINMLKKLYNNFNATINNYNDEMKKIKNKITYTKKEFSNALINGIDINKE